MKEVQITMYEAVDGRKFDTEAECVKHDVELLDQLLGTLSQGEIKNALRRVGLLVRSDRLPPPPPPPSMTTPREDAAGTARVHREEQEHAEATA